jgi:hypothetical protein
MPPQYNRNQILQQFFKPVDREAVLRPSAISLEKAGVRKGSLVSFNYTFWKHDLRPLVVVSEAFAGGKLWGVNIHYLTFPYIKRLIAISSKNPAFSYSSISRDLYMKKAFRSYKWGGIGSMLLMEQKPLVNIISMARSFDPAEVEIIRKNAQDQISRQINPKASQMTNLEGEGAPAGGE